MARSPRDNLLSSAASPPPSAPSAAQAPAPVPVFGSVSSEAAAAAGSPPTVHASQFIMGVNPNEMLLTVGLPRMMFDAAGSPTTGIEWLMTLVMAPGAAANLRDVLSHNIEAFERSYGKIVRDPLFKLPPLTLPGARKGA